MSHYSKGNQHKSYRHIEIFIYDDGVLILKLGGGYLDVHF